MIAAAESEKALTAFADGNVTSLLPGGWTHGRRWPDLELCRQEPAVVLLSPKIFQLLAKRFDCDFLLVEDVIDWASPRRPSLST